jgi:ribosome-binding factor A
MQYRDRRVADAIRDTVADIILNRLSDPLLAHVTVTRCHVTRDLRNATVFISVMGDETRRQAALEHLGRARGHIRWMVGRRIRLKFLPELGFELDELLAHEQRIGEILDTLKPEPTEESPPNPPPEL